MDEIASRSSPPSPATPDTPSEDEGWVDDDPLYGHTQYDIPEEEPKYEYPWPAKKFGMKYKDLFEKLAPRFNMCWVPLQNTYAFAQDVRDAAMWASTPQELYDALAARRALVRKALEDDFDKAQVAFREREPPDLTFRQWSSMSLLLRCRTLSSVLGVVQAYNPAPDDCASSTKSGPTGKMPEVEYIHLHPVPGRAETLPPSPPAAPLADPPPSSWASPALSANSSLPDTLPPYIDSSPERSRPGSPLLDSQPRDSLPAEQAGDEAIDPGAGPLPTTPTMPTPASADAPAFDDRRSSPASSRTASSKTASNKTASSKTASSNTGASPAMPPVVKTILEVPGCSDDANDHSPSQPFFILPPCPPSRKRRRAQGDADDGEAASSPRQPKSAKRRHDNGLTT